MKKLLLKQTQRTPTTCLPISPGMEHWIPQKIMGHPNLTETHGHNKTFIEDHYLIITVGMLLPPWTNSMTSHMNDYHAIDGLVQGELSCHLSRLEEDRAQRRGHATGPQAWARAWGRERQREKGERGREMSGWRRGGAQEYKGQWGRREVDCSGTGSIFLAGWPSRAILPSAPPPPSDNSLRVGRRKRSITVGYKKWWLCKTLVMKQEINLLILSCLLSS